MQTTELDMLKKGLLAGVMALAIIAVPAYAAEVSTGDNATQILSESSAPDPSLAMAASSLTSEALSSFGPSSGTVVGNRALELRDEILRLRSSVNLNSNDSPFCVPVALLAQCSIIARLRLLQLACKTVPHAATRFCCANGKKLTLA